MINELLQLICTHQVQFPDEDRVQTVHANRKEGSQFQCAPMTQMWKKIFSYYRECLWVVVLEEEILICSGSLTPVKQAAPSSPSSGECD